VAVCPVDNLGIEEGRVVAFERCTGCGLCELHCPDFAITAVRADAKSTAAKGNGG
jgi:NAD-dependent dihydropyrimidine dehydrogenase PreA subunit